MIDIDVHLVSNMDMQTDIAPSISRARPLRPKILPVKLDCRGRIICKENGNLGARVVKWRATLGKKITGGAKERKFFDTEKEAKDWIDNRVDEKKRHGESALPLATRAEVVGCLKKLDPFNATLTQAVDFYVKHATPPGGQRLRFEQVKELFLKDRAGSLRETSLKSFKSRLGIVSRSFGKRFMSEIGTAKIKRWLDTNGGAPKTRNNFIGDLSNLFNFAIAEKYCGRNPLTDINTSKVRHEEPEKLTPAQARNLLLASLVECREMTAGLAIALFAGLRRSELCALDWSEVHLNEREIIITSEKAKTSTRRVVTIQENLALWLEPYVRDHGPVLYFKAQFSDALHPMDVDTFGKKLKRLVDGNGKRPAIVSPWPDNAMRHSFCSYFYGQTKNINLTAAEAGNSPRMVELHYKGLAREAEVKDYWNILLAGEATNIVPMAATA